MSANFDDLFTSDCKHCGDALAWEWNEDNVHFTSTCSCLAEYSLTPTAAVFEQTNDVEDDEPSEE